jgi:uncharacterized protein YacL
MKKIIFLTFLIFISSLEAADTSQIEALSANASDIYATITSMAKSMVFILALFPAMISIWAIQNGWKTYRKFKDSDADSSHAVSMLEEGTGFVIRFIFAMLSLFLIYGTFVTIYANPNGTRTFVEAWRILVTTFWKQVI